MQAERFGTDTAIGEALRCAAALETGRRSVALYARAVAYLEASPCAYEHAVARVEYGIAAGSATNWPTAWPWPDPAARTASSHEARVFGGGGGLRAGSGDSARRPPERLSTGRRSSRPVWCRPPPAVVVALEPRPPGWCEDPAWPVATGLAPRLRHPRRGPPRRQNTQPPQATQHLARLRHHPRPPAPRTTAGPR